MPSMEAIVDMPDDISSDEEVEEAEEEMISDPFENAECNEINRHKKLRRGLQYVKSNYVGEIMDVLPDRIHVYKGHVRASMNAIAYLVQVGMAQISGNIIRCTCECPQRTLGRCSHVSALLLSILLHKHLNGPGGKLLLAWILVKNISRFMFLIIFN